MFRRFKWCLVLVAVSALASPALGVDFFDDFESYAPGSQIHGQGGWKGWGNTAGAGAPVSSEYAYSGSNSVEIGGPADLVHEFGAAGGLWEFSTMQYIPSGSSGTNWFILLNQYGDAGPNDWSVQNQHNLGTGVITSSYHGITTPIVFDEWVEWKFEIDLDTNAVAEYYNGAVVSSYTWDDNTHGTLMAVDLYGAGASPIYYDDVFLGQVQDVTWDVAGHTDLTWEGSSNWSPAGTPHRLNTAIVPATNSDTITVNTPDAVAFGLTVEGGGIAIADGQTLSVRRTADFAAGTTLALGAGATFSAQGGAVDTLTTAGNAVIDVTSAGMNVATFNNGGIAGTFTKAGAGSLTLDNSSGTAVVATDALIKVQGGTLNTNGADPLGGATGVELAGGMLSVGGDIAGFDGGSDFTLNSSASGVPRFIDPGTLQITTEVNSLATSAFHNTPQDVTSFRVEFDYQMLGGSASPADGMVLVFQNVGTDALGTGGGGRGYTGIESSVGVSLNLWQNRSDIDEGLNGVLPTGGAAADGRHPTAPVDLQSGNVIHTMVAYDGTTITVDLKDLNTGSTHSESWEVDIPAAVGGDTAWIGFTGGTGGANADQRIANFLHVADPYPIELEGTDVLVTADSSLRAIADGTARFGNLTLAGGVLSTQGSHVGGIAFLKTDIDPAATAVGIDPQVPTDFGVIDAQGANVTFIKGGPSTWVIEDVNPVSNMGPDADWEVRDGVLELKGANPIDGRPITVTGGTLTMDSGEPLGGAPVTLNGGTMRLTAPPMGVPSEDVGEVAEGMVIRFDASTGVTVDAGGVVTWANSAPGADGTYDATVNAAAAAPVLVDGAINGNDAVRFDGSNQQRMSFAEFMDLQSLFLVVKEDEDANVRAPVVGHSANYPFNRGVAPRGSIWQPTWASRQVKEGVTMLDGVRVDGTATAPPTEMGIFSLVTTGYLTTVASDVPDTGIRTGVNQIGQDRVSADRSWDGDIADVIIYDTQLTDAQVLQMTQHLAYRYGIEVDSQSDYSAVDLTVTADSTLDVDTPFETALNSLTLHSGTLSTTGRAASVTFTGTTIDAGTGGAVGLNLGVPTGLGLIDVVGADPVTVTKTGSSDLVLTEASVGAGLENATFAVQEGRLVGVNGFGAAGLTLDGGELVLAGATTGGAQLYDKTVNVNVDSTLTAGAAAAGAAGPVDVTLGSAANGLTLNSGAELLLRSTDGYTLTVAGPVTGSGRINLPEGVVALNGGGNVPFAEVSGGTLNVGADLNVEEMLITSGTVNTGASTLIVSDTLRFGLTPYIIDSEHTFTAEGADLLSGTTLTLSGGVLDVGIGDVTGGIDGFGDGSQYTLNANAGAQTAGVPAINGGELQITSTANSQGTSVYHNTPKDIRTFRIEFDYQLTDPGTGTYPADGMALVIQNAGLDALGTGGGGRGYLGITDSVAVSLNLWSNRSDIDEGLNGVIPQGGADADLRHPTAPVDLKSGDVIHTTVDYDGTAITVDLEDMDTGDTYSYSWEVDIPTAVDADTALIGFTGGTGAANADQIITDFEFYYPLDPIDAGFISLAVADDSVLALNTTEDANFGDLAVDPGRSLTIENVAASFNDVTLGAGAMVSAEAMIIRGTLSSGGNPGAFILDGELEFDDTGIYRADPSADALAVTADAFLAGSLELVAGGPMGDLAAGEWGTSTRAILSAAGGEGAIVDSFENVPAAGDHLGSGVFFESLAYTPEGDEATELQVTVFQAAPGDTNGDGEVNNSDLQQILGAGSFNVGDGWAWPQGDFDGSGTVNNSDLQLILATGLFGAGTYAAGAGLAAVPEPATIVLLASGMLGLLLVLWRRRKRA